MTALLLVAASGCATGLTHSGSHEDAASQPHTVSEVIQQDLNRASNTIVLPNSAVPVGSEIVINGVKLKNTRFDIPITINSRVEYWIGYFTGKGRVHMTKYLERSEFFIPYIRPLLKQNGLPRIWFTSR